MPAPRIEAAVADSPLIAEALQLARSAHRGQLRKGSGGMPFIEHPLAVAELVASVEADEALLAAALLHDVVEDSETTVEEIEARLGPGVAGLVATLSDDEAIEAYEPRKREHRERVSNAGRGALTIYAADKLANVQVLRRAYAAEGERIAEELKVPLDVKLEAWRRDLEMLRRSAVPDLPFLDALELELERLARQRAA